jgi:hypothetical protein
MPKQRVWHHLGWFWLMLPIPTFKTRGSCPSPCPCILDPGVLVSVVVVDVYNLFVYKKTLVQALKKDEKEK